MDPRIKAGIFAGESGGDYDTLFGWSHRQGGPFAGTRLRDMTVDQALQFASPRGPYASWVKNKIGRVATPMGAYQIVGTTLKAAKKGLGLTGTERMDEATQDRLGEWILKAQGTDAWAGYRGPRDPSSVKVATQAAFSGKSGKSNNKTKVTSGAQALIAPPTIGQTQDESGVEKGPKKSSVSESLATAYQEQMDAQKAASWEWVREAMRPQRTVTPFNIWGGRNG